MRVYGPTIPARAPRAASACRDCPRDAAAVADAAFLRRTSVAVKRVRAPKRPSPANDYVGIEYCGLPVNCGLFIV
jgi:hypothetical protein